MRKNIISLFVISWALAACQPHGAPVEYIEYAADNVDVVGYRPVATAPCDSDTSVSMIKYSVPADGDLTLETRHHVIQIQGAPNSSYEYRVWAGGKNYDADPDLIVDDGNIMVLQENQ